MPCFDIQCSTCGVVVEHFVNRYDDVIACDRCGGPTVKLFGRFAVPFTKSLHHYMDPNREGSDRDGFWAVRTKSAVAGQSEDVYLDSIQAIREFNAAEGLSAPGELPTNATISSDGKKILSSGMPGQWAAGYSVDTLPSALWRMNKSTTSIHGKDPAPPPSGCTAQVVDAGMMEQFAAEAGG